MPDKRMTVEQAIEMVAAEEWSGDLRIVATRLSCAGRVLVQALQERERAARWLLPFLVNEPAHLSNAISQWPWLEEVT